MRQRTCACKKVTWRQATRLHLQPASAHVGAATDRTGERMKETGRGHEPRVRWARRRCKLSKSRGTRYVGRGHTAVAPRECREHGRQFDTSTTAPLCCALCSERHNPSSGRARTNTAKASGGADTSCPRMQARTTERNHTICVAQSNARRRTQSANPSANATNHVSSQHRGGAAAPLAAAPPIASDAKRAASSHNALATRARGARTCLLGQVSPCRHDTGCVRASLDIKK